MGGSEALASILSFYAVISLVDVVIISLLNFLAIRRSRELRRRFKIVRLLLVVFLLAVLLEDVDEYADHGDEHNDPDS